MDIIRIPKVGPGSTMVHLVIDKTYGTTVRAVITVTGSMSSSAEMGEYPDVEQAEAAAMRMASQRNASALVIEDRT